MSQDVDLRLGDCREVLKTLEADSVDSLVTDPPSGINFMGADWDADKGGRDEWIAWLRGVMSECFRVMKPGAHGLVWALPRTSHWTGMALELAGFECRDVISHCFGSGFPKSLDIGKAIDRTLGAEREVVGEWRPTGTARPVPGKGHAAALSGQGPNAERSPLGTMLPITVNTTSEAQEWSGFGTALKPGHETWWLVRKPLRESSIARQVLATGTGAINIDATRVGARNQTVVRGGNSARSAYGKFAHDDKIETFSYQNGRWPANALFSHSCSCEPKGERRVPGASGWSSSGSKAGENLAMSGANYAREPKPDAHTDTDGMEAVIDWSCSNDCPIAELDRQSGETRSGETRSGETRGTGGIWSPSSGKPAGPQHGDSGGASRFFPTFHPFYYSAKPSRSERDEGLGEIAPTMKRRVNPGGLENDPRWAPVEARNIHPTVKSLSLMAWLCKLVTPPGGVILDPFAGSGSTGVAALREGFRFVGIEQDPKYHAIAAARLENARTIEPWELPLFADLAPGPTQPSLFDAIQEANS